MRFGFARLDRTDKGVAVPELLATERAFLKKNIETLAHDYPGRYLLIKGENVHGAFETYELAVEAGIKLFGRGPFLARSVTDPDPDPVTIPVLAAGVPLVSDTER